MLGPPSAWVSSTWAFSLMKSNRGLGLWVRCRRAKPVLFCRNRKVMEKEVNVDFVIQV